MRPSCSPPRFSPWKFLARWAAPALGLLTAALAPEVLAQDAGTPSAKGARSLSYPSDNGAQKGWSIKISVNGGPKDNALVDTGSLGLAVPMRLVGGNPRPARPEELPQPAPPNTITYSSSNVTLVGQWVMAKVEFPDGHVTDSMPVLGVVAKCEPGTSVKDKHDGRKSGHVPVPVPIAEVKKLYPQIDENAVCVEWGGGMMGVGFDRGHFGPEKSVTPPQYNALRQLSATLARKVPGVRQGYIIHSGSVEVGLTEENTRSFQWVQLSPAPSSPPQWPDWQSLPGCFRLEYGKEVWKSDPGTVLVDTGLTNMYLSNPTLPSGPTSSPEASITVMSPCDDQPVLSQVFQRPEDSHKGKALVPSKVSLSARPSFVNTGSHLMEKWDYAYDAQNGRVGFMPQRH